MFNCNRNEHSVSYNLPAKAEKLYSFAGVDEITYGQANEIIITAGRGIFNLCFMGLFF